MKKKNKTSVEYICLKPVYKNSLPINDFKVLSFSTLKDARRCQRVMRINLITIAKILPSEVERWREVKYEKQKQY